MLGFIYVRVFNIPGLQRVLSMHQDAIMEGLRIFQDIECARFLHMQALHKVLNMAELTDALINCSGYRRVLNMPDQSFKVLNMPLVVNARARNMTRL